MPPQLQRKLGSWACISIVVGSVIGSSIFMKPATMASQLGSPVLLLIVWVVAGIISIFGGMINAEIGSMLPETGGQYAYFRHMYGKFFAYLYGWASFIVINTASVAAIAFISAQYLTYFTGALPGFSEATQSSVVITLPFIGEIFPLQNFAVKLIAIILVVVLTFVNHRSLKAGAVVQILFTILKVAALIFLIGSIFLLGKGSVGNLALNSHTMNFSPWMVITGFVAATSGALAAYDGWNNLGFVGGEIRNPQKNIPRGLIWGLIVCIFLYLLTSEAYLYMMPIDEIKNSPLVATDALSKIMGGGAAVIALLVIISAAGATNGNILPSVRISYAMAKDGLFFRQAAHVSKTHHTPHVALWMHCFVTCLFILTGSFDMLADLFVFVSWLFYGFGAYGIFILRKKMPDANRPYQLKGYPVIPIIFILFSMLYFFITIYTDVHNYTTGKSKLINSALGLALLVTGVPFYFYFIRMHKHQKTFNADIS